MTTRAGCRSAANSQGRRSTLGVLRSTLPFWSVDAAKGNIPDAVKIPHRQDAGSTMPVMTIA